MTKTTTDYTIPDPSSPGSARTAPVIAHQGEGVKWATDDDNKLRTRSNIGIGTSNVRTLRPPGKLEELAHEKISLECPWTLWGTIEELWRNNYSGWTYALLQWQRGQTWKWGWFSCSQGRREHSHGVPANFQQARQAHHHSSQGNTF